MRTFMKKIKIVDLLIVIIAILMALAFIFWREILQAFCTTMGWCK